MYLTVKSPNGLCQLCVITHLDRLLESEFLMTRHPVCQSVINLLEMSTLRTVNSIRKGGRHLCCSKLMICRDGTSVFRWLCVCLCSPSLLMLHRSNAAKTQINTLNTNSGEKPFVSSTTSAFTHTHAQTSLAGYVA